MKTNLKLIAALTCLYFVTTTAFAQKKKADKKTAVVQASASPVAQTNSAPFIGIWELFKMSGNGQPLQDHPPGYLKIYNTDGTCTTVQFLRTGSVIKGSAYYAVDNDQTYSEADKAEDLTNNSFKINYEFSEDKQVLTIGYSYKDGTAFTEAYRKLAKH